MPNRFATMDDDRLADLVIDGRNANSLDAGMSLTSASMNLSTTQLSDMSLKLVDTEGLDFMKRGVLRLGAITRYGAWTHRVNGYTMSHTSDGLSIDVSTQSLFVYRLKARTGGYSWGNVDVSTWVGWAARTAGAQLVVQPGLGVRQITRAAPTDGGNAESSWDVLVGLARATGCWFFEYGPQFVFARPSWLRSQPWGGLRLELYANSLEDMSPGLTEWPTYTISEGQEPRETVKLKLDSWNAFQLRPGDMFIPKGELTRTPVDGEWMITNIGMPFTSDSPVTVTCQRPIDPAIPKEQPAKTVGGYTGSIQSPGSPQFGNVTNPGGLPGPTPGPTITVNPGGGKANGEVDRWAQSVLGRSIDMDGAYGAQCVDLTQHYMANCVRGPQIFGNGNQWFANGAGNPSVVQVNPSTRAQKGDIACWVGVYGGGYGHVAVVTADQGGTLDTISQNPGPARHLQLTKGGLAGYLRPRKYM